MDSSTTRTNKLLLELSQRFNQVSNAESSNQSELFKKTNRAAVLVCLFEEHDDVYVILTKRSSKLSSYSGEVSLPGGRMDEDDTDDIQTALREAKEEIGLDPALVDVVTVLEPFITKCPWTQKDHKMRYSYKPSAYIGAVTCTSVFLIVMPLHNQTKRNVTVVPVIGILWNKQAFSPAPNAEEVESIFYAPFEMFLKDRNRRQEEKEFQGDQYFLHYFDHVTNNKEYIIWALTAGILITAASLVYQRPPDFHLKMPKFWNRNYSKF